jgi:hypothetical protein
MGLNMRLTNCLVISFTVAFALLSINVSAFGAQIKIMPLGDSITQGSSSGESVQAKQVAYRKALFDQLNDEIVNGVPGDPDPNNKLATWLNVHQPDIVLLHIGTNDLDPSDTGPDDVEAILDEIDVYDLDAWVILARIIAREDDICSGNPPITGTDTTTFNNKVETVAQGRINDKIVFVDMECWAGIDYRRQPLGDMNDLLHPYAFGTGYDKMADVWFAGLLQILPVADAGLDQSV